MFWKDVSFSKTLLKTLFPLSSSLQFSLFPVLNVLLLFYTNVPKVPGAPRSPVLKPKCKDTGPLGSGPAPCPHLTLVTS